MDPSNANSIMEIVRQVGVGGGIAVFMFLLYRRDSMRWADVQEKQAVDWRSQYLMTVEVVKENTASNVKLSSAVDALHRRLDDNHFQQHRP